MWFLLLAFLAQTADFQAQGLKALDERKYEDAAALFSRAVAADPKDYGAHFNLALAYSLMDKDASAIAEYKRVLELRPGLYEAELNLGLSLLRTKDAAGAVGHLRSAAETKPSEIRPRVLLGDALF